jgi:hypothetical protein
VFKTADQTHTTTLKAANELAETRIQQAKNESLFLKKNFHNQAWIRVS